MMAGEIGLNFQGNSIRDARSIRSIGERLPSPVRLNLMHVVRAILSGFGRLTRNLGHEHHSYKKAEICLFNANSSDISLRVNLTEIRDCAISPDEISRPLALAHGVQRNCFSIR